MIGPVCMLKGTAKDPAAAAVFVAPDAAKSFSVAGPSVPDIDWSAVRAAAGRTPVMPERENRGE